MLEQESPNIAPTPTLSQPGLLVMDVDSTLIDEEVIDELGAAAGIGEQIASITARAMNGELDFREALQARVVLLRICRLRYSMMYIVACILRTVRLI